jgi:hypothetical protein
MADNVTVRITVPEEIASTLIRDDELARHFTKVQPAAAQAAARLDLDLTTAASVITIVVGVVQLADYAKKLASVLYRRYRDIDARGKIVIEGATNDRAVSVAQSNPTELTQDIVQAARGTGEHEAL